MLMLKKLFARLFFPVPLLGLLLLAGVILIWRSAPGSRAHRVGKWLLVGVLVLYYLIGVTGVWWLTPLTNRYPVLNPATLPVQPYVIAVAGNGIIPDDDGRPNACRFNETMTLRLWEAGRIAQGLQQRDIPFQLVVSIGDPADGAAMPQELKRQALEEFFALFQVPPTAIRIVDEARNSRQELLAFRAFPGCKILVSSAYHLPRLMRLAERYDCRALPAPVGVRRAQPELSWLRLVPASENFEDAQRAVYEWLGMVEYLIF